MKIKTACFLLAFMVAVGALAAAPPEVFFSPNRNNERIVSEFIRGAKKELLIEAYSITNSVIADSVREAKRRGVRVEMICDKANSQKLNDHCVSLGGKPDKKYGLMHNKVMIRDRECVLTGSFNFTNNAVRNNRENFMILCDKRTADLYAAEFFRLMENNT